MKKLLMMVVLLVLLVVSFAHAEITALPNETSVITLYDLEVHALKLGLRYPALNWEETVYLDGGVITNMDSTSVIGGLSIEICALGRLLGLNVNLAQKIVFGFSGGYNFMEKCPTYGPYGGISWKW